MSYCLYHSCLDTQPTPSLISFSSSSRTAMVTGEMKGRLNLVSGLVSGVLQYVIQHKQTSDSHVIINIALKWSFVAWLLQQQSNLCGWTHVFIRSLLILSHDNQLYPSPFPSLLFLTTNHEQRQVCVCIVLHCFPTSSSGTTYRLLLHSTHLQSVSCC